MSIFDYFIQKNINDGIRRYKSWTGSILLDVRSKQEYQEGHIPGSKNLPLQEIQNIKFIVPDKSIPLYVYCQSGTRSRQAVSILQHMGYTNVENIGGIDTYSGKLEE